MSQTCSGVGVPVSSECDVAYLLAKPELFTFGYAPPLYLLGPLTAAAPQSCSRTSANSCPGSVVMHGGALSRTKHGMRAGDCGNV